MREGRSVYRVLVGRPKWKGPLVRPMRMWEDNIKMNLRKTGIDGANWIRLAQDRVQWRVFVNTVMITVKLSMCFTKHQAMKTYWETGGIVPRII
jgi:hypothetical protein